MATQLTLNDGSLNSAGSLLLKTNGTTTAVTIDTSQNMGLGVTPSAWVGTGNQRAIQISTVGSISSLSNATGNQQLNLGRNVYDFYGAKYLTSDTASAFRMLGDNTFAWYQAASGTAGNTISFTQAMTLDASGNLGIGETSPTQKISVGGRLNYTSFSTNVDTFGLWATSAEGTTLSAYTGYNIAFRIANSEKARIDSSGNLLVGTTNSDPKASGVTGVVLRPTNIEVSTSGTGGFFNLTSGTGTLISFRQANNVVGTISVTASATSYNTSSDYRLKENIQPMQNALATVAQLKPVTYTWKADGSDGEGFIAHELQAVVPQCVTGEKDALDAEGNPVYQGIDTSFLVATLTAAIQEQQAIITSLTERITALEAK